MADMIECFKEKENKSEIKNFLKLSRRQVGIALGQVVTTLGQIVTILLYLLRKLTLRLAFIEMEMNTANFNYNFLLP